MIKISDQRIPVRKKRIATIIIHYLLNSFFFLYNRFIRKSPFVKKELQFKKIKKLLVIRIDFLGDVTMSTPAFIALRKIFPHAHITLLAAHLSKELVEVMPVFDNIIYFNAPWIVKKRKYGWANLIKIIRELKTKKFDLCIDLRGDFRHNILMFLANIKYRVGFSITGCDFLLTHVIPCGDNHHHVKLCLDTIKYFNPEEGKEDSLHLWVKDKDRKYAENVFRAACSNFRRNNSLLIMIHPGASWEGRYWKAERYAEVADKLIENYDAKIIISGGPNDSKIVDHIMNLMKFSAIKSSRTSLRQFLALLEKCDFFIGSDSGPMHMATAMGVKVIALFGPAMKEVCGPWGSRHSIITHQKDFDCSPCDQKKCKKPYNSCMDEIKVEEVWVAAKTQITKKLSNEPGYSTK